MFLKENWSKKGISEKKCAPFFWGVLASLPCCRMMALDALEGCAKNPIKIKKQKKEGKKKPKKVTPKKWGALKTGRK